MPSQAVGSGELETLKRFMTDLDGAAIINSVGPIGQIADARHADERRNLVIAKSDGIQQGSVVKVQAR